MTLGEPLWLLLPALLVPALLLVFILSEQSMRRRLRTFAASKLGAELTASYSPARRRVKIGFTLLAVLFLGLALARPQYGVVLEESQARGIDFMIALDTSRSMLAEDVKPNRLERAKLAILDLVNATRGDRVGLLAFAGDAFLQCPLTLDYDAFRATLAATDTEVIARGGTDLALAIREGRAALGEDNNFKLLVLLTDGEDLEASALQAAREAADAGVRIFTVGVGGAEGQLIPIRDATGNPTYLRDASGNLVRSSLDEATLREIAALTNGAYAPLGAGGGLRQIYERLVDELPAAELGARFQEIPLERFRWPVTLALALLFFEPLIGTRRNRGAAGLASGVNLLLLGGLLLPFAADLGASPVRALALYQDGQYEESARLFSEALEARPDDPRLHYNLGNSYYKLQRWDDARHAFSRALESSDPSLQADAFFNLGNALYQLGLATTDDLEGRQSRLEFWQQALEAYQNSAALLGGREDLERNTGVVSAAVAAITRRLEVLVDPAGAGEAGPAGRFLLGAGIELEAKATDGWLFRTWEGAPVEKPGEPRTTLTLSDDVVLTARFVKTWHLEVRSADPAKGSAEKSGDYPADQPATISATAKDHFAFKEWIVEGAEVSPLDQPEAQVTLTQDATVTATFVDAFYLEVVGEPQIGGSAGTTGWYEVYSDVDIQAQPREGFEWIGWLGEGVADPTAPQTFVTMLGERRAVARFDRIWNLIVVPSDEQGGTVSGGGDFPVGSTHPITATPNEGYTFGGWQGPGVSDPSAPETTVTVESEEHDVIAVFTPDEQNENENENENESQDDSQQEQEQEPQDSESESDPSDEPQEPQEPDAPQENEAESEEEQEPEPTEPEEPQPADAEPEAEAMPERVEGQMTEEEARQLLNALRESEKKLPAVRRTAPGDSTGRDW